MQKHTNKKKKTDTRTGKTAVKKKNSRSKKRKSSRVRQRNQRILMSLMPVSYTHLDVYKRQTISKEMPEMWKLYGGKGE